MALIHFNSHFKHFNICLYVLYCFVTCFINRQSILAHFFQRFWCINPWRLRFEDIRQQYDEVRQQNVEPRLRFKVFQWITHGGIIEKTCGAYPNKWKHRGNSLEIMTSNLEMIARDTPIVQCTIWLFNIAMENPPIFQNGKPVNHLFRLGPSIPWLC